MAREPWRITEQTEFLGQDMDSEPDQIAKGYVRRLVDFEPEGGAIRERDPLEKWNITWPEYYTAPVVGLARGRFFDDIYPTVVFLVDAAGHLYYLEAGQAPGSYDAHGLQRFWTNPTWFDAAQLEDKLIISDGNLMVQAWAEDGAVHAEVLEAQVVPGVPYFETDWWDYWETALVGDVDLWIESGGNGQSVAAVAYRLTYVWNDEEEGGPGPRSEPYLLGAWGWDGWTMRAVTLNLPPWPTLEDPPDFVHVYRAFCTNLYGDGGPGWSAFGYVGRAGYGATQWVDIVQSEGAGITERTMSMVPAGKHLKVAGEDPRLFIGHTQEGFDLQPCRGTTHTAFVNGTWSPDDEVFEKRVRINFESQNRTTWGGGIPLYFQNTSPGLSDCTQEPGGYVAASSFRIRVVGFEPIRHRFTRADGITPIISRVAYVTDSAMKVYVKLPQVFSSISYSVYLYYDEEAPAEEPGWNCWMNYSGMRHPFGCDDEFRQNGARSRTYVMVGVNQFASWQAPCSSAVRTLLEWWATVGGNDQEVPSNIDEDDIRTCTVIDQHTTGDYTSNIQRYRRCLALRTFGSYDDWSWWQLNRTIDDCARGSTTFRVWRGVEAGGHTLAQGTTYPFSLYDDVGAARELYITFDPGAGTDLDIDVNGSGTPYTVAGGNAWASDEDCLYIGLSWSGFDARLYVAEMRGGVITLHDPVDFAGIITPNNMANLRPRYAESNADYEENLVGDIMFTVSREVSDEENYAEMALLAEPYHRVYVASEDEDIGVREEFPNRGRWCEPSTPRIWRSLAYRDVGAKDHPINYVGNQENYLAWCKPDGIFPMLLRTGGDIQFTESGPVSETVFWNPQTLASDKRGWAGCSAPGAGMDTPDGVWLFAGNQVIRWDGQKIWDHTDGMRSQFVTSQAWRTETPVLFFWEPVRQNLMLAWKDSGVWRVAGIRKTFVKGQKVWGWFEHQGYQPAVVSRSPGVVQGDLLLCDGAIIYFFNQNLQTGTYAAISPWVQLPDLRLIKGNVRGFGVSFSGADTMAASVFLDGQAVHSYTSIVSDKQYPVRRANARKFGLKLYGGSS